MNAHAHLHLPTGKAAASTPAAWSFAGLIAALQAEPDLDGTRRRDLVSGLTLTAEMLKLPAAAVPCDIAWLNEHLFRHPPAVFGKRPRHFRNIISLVRRALRWAGLHQRRQRGERGLPAEWLALLEAARFDAHRAVLRPLAWRCASLDLAPVDVTDEIIADFLERERRTRLAAGSGRLGGTLVRAWNRTVTANGATAGCRHLKAPPRRRPYTLPFESYPESFQAEVRAFAERLGLNTGSSVFGRRRRVGANPAQDERREAARGPRAGFRRLRPAAVKTRLFAIRQAAAALVQMGRDPATITGLRVLVDPVDNADDILAFFEHRALEKLPEDQRADAQIVGGQLAVIADTLWIVGRHVVGLTGEPLDELRAMRMGTHPKHQAGLTGKVRERLLRLIQPLNRSRLLLLAEDEQEAARRAGAADLDTARRIMVTIAVEILLCCPLRMQNLTNLRLDRHLQRFAADGRWINHVAIDGTATKNHAEVEWPVPPSTAKLLDAWTRIWRPLVAGDDGTNPHLFPGREAGRAMSQSGLAQAIKRFIATELGLEVHPHLLRHFAAWRHLRRYPGQYEIVRRALGHRSIETTVNMYCGLEAEAAARVFHRGLEDDRVEARRLRALGTARVKGRRS